MKTLALAGAVLGLAIGCTSTLSAAEKVVSQTTLNTMGFGTAQALSDQDGMLVRGKGFSGGQWGDVGRHSRWQHHCHPQPICHPKHCVSIEVSQVRGAR